MDENFFPGLDIGVDEDAGHEAAPRMIEGHEFGVRHEAMVGLVGKGGPETDVRYLRHVQLD